MDPTELKNEFMRVSRKLQRVNIGSLLDGVSQGEYFALEMIGKQPRADGKGIYVSELAKSLAIASSATSRILHSLEEKELVTREADRDDRRNTRVRLTENGERVRRTAADKIDAFSIRSFSRMGGEDAVRLIELWNRMADIMAEECEAMTKGETR